MIKETMTATRPIWIDLDNSPHVPFFRPIVDALRAQGFEVVVTARDAFNVTDLIRLHDVECIVIGRHFGKNRLMKVLGLGVRAMQLLPLVAKCRPCMAVSHGSRAQTLAAKLLRVPSIVIADYEHVTHVTRPDCMIVPEVIPGADAGRAAKRVLKYPGIKEDVYASSFVPNPALPVELGLLPDEVIATVRPPATEAHYHSPESDTLFDAALGLLIEHPRCRIVLLPRNDLQKAELTRRYPAEVRSRKIVIPERAVDGLNLVWHSDLVISGGGTMNREAAALGVPVYSVFRGPIGAVDRYLSAKGRLVLLESVADVRHRVRLDKRERVDHRAQTSGAALASIVGHIVAATSTRAPAPMLKGGEA